MSGSELAHLPAVAQHHQALGNPLQIGQAMGNVENRHATFAQGVDQGEQALRFGVRQRCSGLVEDQQAWLQRQRPGQDHQLLFGLAKAFDRLMQGQVQTQAGGDGRRALEQALAVDPQPCARQAQLVEHQVFANAQARRNAVTDVLVHGDDADPARRHRRNKTLQFALHPQLALVVALAAGEDLDQGRLAGAIGAEQCDNFTREYLQVHLIECAMCSKSLAEAAYPDKRLG